MDHQYLIINLNIINLSSSKSLSLKHPKNRPSPSPSPSHLVPIRKSSRGRLHAFLVRLHVEAPEVRGDLWAAHDFDGHVGRQGPEIRVGNEPGETVKGGRKMELSW